MGAAFQAAANVARQQQGVAKKPGMAPGVPPVTTPNRFTRTRTRPIQPGGPQMQPTNPAITNPNVRIGVPMQPPITKRPVTGGPDPIPSFVTPPPADSMTAQVITPITNPATGETYMAPNAGYKLAPGVGGPQMQPGNPAITNPNVSIGTPVQAPGGKSFGDVVGGPFVPGFGTPMPQPQLEAMPYTGNPAYQPTQATQQNPNVSIGFGGGVGNVFGAPFSGIGSAFTRASQQPDMSEKDIQALQGFGQAFSNLGSSFASTMGSAMPLLSGKSQPAQPGMGQAFSTGPTTGGFNPSLGNTTLPGNF